MDARPHHYQLDILHHFFNTLDVYFLTQKPLTFISGLKTESKLMLMDIKTLDNLENKSPINKDTPV